jgi:hypothetical protein
MLTLNQTIEILKNFTSKHKQLNSFYFGDKWEVGASKTVQYPLLWCSLINSSVTNNVITRRFQIDISDKVNLDESNETHVISDCEQIAFDLLNYLEQISDSGEIGITIVKDSSLTDYTENRDDMVSGWFFEISISSHIFNNSCNLPINSGNIFDGNYIYVGGTTSGTTCAFQVDIKDQDGNILQTFTTSGTYTVEVLQEIIDTITNNTATIIDPIN